MMNAIMKVASLKHSLLRAIGSIQVCEGLVAKLQSTSWNSPVADDTYND
jgi:hypothetical protein